MYRVCTKSVYTHLYKHLKWYSLPLRGPEHLYEFPHDLCKTECTTKFCCSSQQQRCCNGERRRSKRANVRDAPRSGRPSTRVTPRMLLRISNITWWCIRLCRDHGGTHTAVLDSKEVSCTILKACKDGCIRTFYAPCRSLMQFSSFCKINTNC